MNTFSKIKSIRPIGMQKTLDFEVDSKDHNFYANGIVVSNSHSLATSKLTALTVWAKYSYPLNFYKACLNSIKDIPNSLEEIGNITRELPFFDIKLLPPHIIKSTERFTIENKDIRYSLANIKGISEKSILKLADFKNQYSNKFEIFCAAENAGIPKNIMSSLIFCGSLDDMLTESRSKTFLEFVLWSLLTEKEKTYILANNLGPKYSFNLINLVKEMHSVLKTDKNKQIIKDSRFETLKRHFNPYKKIYEHNSKNEKLASYFFENSLLGYSFSCNLIDLYINDVPDLITLLAAKTASEKEYVHIVGQVREFKEATSQKKNKYWKISLTDHSGNLDILLSSNEREDKINDCIELNGGIKPKEDDILIVRGSKGSDIIFANSISIQETKIFERISQLKDFKETT